MLLHAAVFRIRTAAGVRCARALHACIVSLLSLHELAGLERLCAKHDIGIAALPHYYGAGGLLNVFGLVRTKAAETTFDSHFRISPVVFAEPPIIYRLGRIFSTAKPFGCKVADKA